MVRWLQHKGSKPVRYERHQGHTTGLDDAQCSAAQYKSSVTIHKLYCHNAIMAEPSFGTRRTEHLYLPPDSKLDSALRILNAFRHQVSRYINKAGRRTALHKKWGPKTLVSSTTFMGFPSWVGSGSACTLRRRRQKCIQTVLALNKWNAFRTDHQWRSFMLKSFKSFNWN